MTNKKKNIDIMSDPRTHRNHRKRMRQRYKNMGLSGFTPHEVLEMLLYRSIPRRNTNAIAHALLEESGNLEKVLRDRPVVMGVGQKTTNMLAETERWLEELFMTELKQCQQQEQLYVLACHLIRRIPEEMILVVECTPEGEITCLHRAGKEVLPSLAVWLPAVVQEGHTCHLILREEDTDTCIPDGLRWEIQKTHIELRYILFLSSDGFTPRWL